MKKSDHQAEYQKQIKKILMEDWDPIGVSDEPEAQTEYDNYIPHIYSQLIHDRPREEIFENLWKVETNSMGLPGDRRVTEKAVESLIKLRDQMESIR